MDLESTISERINEIKREKSIEVFLNIQKI